MKRFFHAVGWIAAILFAAVWLLALVLIVVPARLVAFVLLWCGGTLEDGAKGFRSILESVGGSLDYFLYKDR